MELLEVILKLLAILGGLATPVFFVVFFKYNKRIKKNEADRGEIDNFKSIIAQLKKNQVDMQKEINDLKRDYNHSEKEKIEIEGENNIYKRAFNSQVECQTECEDCPILIKYKLLISKK